MEKAAAPVIEAVGKIITLKTRLSKKKAVDVIVTTEFIQRNPRPEEKSSLNK